MVATLSAIPTGSNLLIDTNVFVYGLTAKSPQCKTLLERCSNEEVFGITLFEVVHEATHVFMLGEAHAKGLFTPMEKESEYLSRHPAAVNTPSDYCPTTHD